MLKETFKVIPCHGPSRPVWFKASCLSRLEILFAAVRRVLERQIGPRQGLSLHKTQNRCKTDTGTLQSASKRWHNICLSHWAPSVWGKNKILIVVSWPLYRTFFLIRWKITNKCSNKFFYCAHWITRTCFGIQMPSSGGYTFLVSYSSFFSMCFGWIWAIVRSVWPFSAN
jgi:hypothetical protein